MTEFPFNQPEPSKTKDCGYRCLYYAVGWALNWTALGFPYGAWLEQFRFFAPVKHGIYFTDICVVLDYYKIDYKFTQLSNEGLYIIYSGSWLKHGHYFIYHNGIVLCSTKSEPERMALADVIAKLESKSIDGAFRCLKILGPAKEEPAKETEVKSE